MDKNTMIKTIQNKKVDYEKLSDAGVAYMAGYMEGLIRGRGLDDSNDGNGHKPTGMPAA